MNTEERIIEAAKDELLDKGYSGARMRSIAEKAEINKGLLHYYFKSKDALLIRVFQIIFSKVFESLDAVFESDKPIFEKIEMAVSVYCDFMARNPRLPYFIISEMNRDPKKHKERMKRAGTKPPFERLIRDLEKAKKEGIIREDLEAPEFMLHMMGMILFPLIAKPMAMFMTDMNEAEYKAYLSNRKQRISTSLIKDIKA